MSDIKDSNVRAEKEQDRQKLGSNRMVPSNKGPTTVDAPFMKSVLPVTSLFSSIKSGVQTGVTAAVKAGKKSSG